MQPFSLANTAAQILLTPVPLDFQPVIHSPQISQYTSVSTVLLIAIFIPSLSHQLIEILNVSGVYQVFLSVWDFLCAASLFCDLSGYQQIFKYLLSILIYHLIQVHSLSHCFPLSLPDPDSSGRISP